MAKNSDNYSVFSDVIMTLTMDAAANVKGVTVLRSNEKSIFKIFKSGHGVSVYFLPNDKITIDLFVEIQYGAIVPDVVSQLQECIKEAVESATKFRVHSINVQVVRVNCPDNI